MSKKPTAKQKRYFSKVVELGCVICQRPAEIHHLLAGTGMAQKDHDRVIPLCPVHHRTGCYGEAIHAGIKGFEYQFGTEEYLLKKVEAML